MPVGVSVLVADGVATIDFVDGSKRGPGLGRLFAVGTPPELVRKLTRSGPRPVYQVPVAYAQKAGLLDEAAAPPEKPVAVSQGYDDGEPDMDWSRAALNEAATKAGVVDADKLPNKEAVLAAYRDATKNG